MTPEEMDLRTRILKATDDLLDEESDPDKITVRRIAERAGVGIGLINYHFHTRENLLNEVIGQRMGLKAGAWLAPQGAAGVDALTRLKNLLKETSNIGARYPKLTRITLLHELQFGQFQPQQLILPLLREIFGGERSEIELRLIALQLVAGMQAVLLRADVFRLYAGIDIFDQTQRDATIDQMVDLYLSKEK